MVALDRLTVLTGCGPSDTDAAVWALAASALNQSTRLGSVQTMPIKLENVGIAGSFAVPGRHGYAPA